MGMVNFCIKMPTVPPSMQMCLQPKLQKSHPTSLFLVPSYCPIVHLYMYIHLPVCLPTLPVCLSVCLSVSLPACLPARPSVCLSRHMIAPQSTKWLIKSGATKPSPAWLVYEGENSLRYHMSDGKKEEEKVDSCGTRTHDSQLYMLTFYRLS